MTIDQDDDLRDLLKKIGVVIVIVLFFTILLVLLYVKKFSLTESRIEKILKNEDLVFILYRKNNCSNCEKIEKILKKKEVYYITINHDKTKKWDTIQEKIELQNVVLENPSLICVKEGKAYSFITQTDNQNEMEEFIDSIVNNP